jgi:ankyrin repeat protein
MIENDIYDMNTISELQHLETMVEEYATVIDLLNEYATHYQTFPLSEYDIIYLNQPDLDGNTPLMLAIDLGGRLEIICILLEHFNDFKIMNAKGQNAITMAKDKHVCWSAQLNAFKRAHYL